MDNETWAKFGQQMIPRTLGDAVVALHEGGSTLSRDDLVRYLQAQLALPNQNIQTRSSLEAAVLFLQGSVPRDSSAQQHSSI